MIYSFVNLVSWRFFINKHSDHNVYLDSVSIRMIAKLTGMVVKEKHCKSGVEYFNENHYHIAKSIFLGPEKNQFFADSYVLPFWKNNLDVVLNQEIVEAIGGHQQITLAISSPKQEILARQIYDFLGPNIDIYCLGAATSLESFSDTRSYRFLWFRFLLQSPQRTLIKIKSTVIEIMLILFQRNRMIEFRNFCLYYLR